MLNKLFPWRWWIWGVFILSWTAALLMPLPQHGDFGFGEIEVTKRYLFAKAVHLSAYAFFAALTGWLRPSPRYRFLLMFTLMAHATLTEMLQHVITYVGRNGDLFDVALDNIGITVGTVLSWKWWTQDTNNL